MLFIVRFFVIFFPLKFIYSGKCSVDKVKTDPKCVKNCIEAEDKNLISELESFIIKKEGYCRKDMVCSKTFLILTNEYIQKFIDECKNNQNLKKIDYSNTSSYLLKKNLLSVLKTIDYSSILLTKEISVDYIESSTRVHTLKFNLYIVIKSTDFKLFRDHFIGENNNDYELYTYSKVQTMILEMDDWLNNYNRNKE